jgi:hypothetical protein
MKQAQAKAQAHGSEAPPQPPQMAARPERAGGVTPDRHAPLWQEAAEPLWDQSGSFSRREPQVPASAAGQPANNIPSSMAFFESLAREGRQAQPSQAPPRPAVAPPRVRPPRDQPVTAPLAL